MKSNKSVGCISFIIKLFARPIIRFFKDCTMFTSIFTTLQFLHRLRWRVSTLLFVLPPLTINQQNSAKPSAGMCIAPHSSSCTYTMQTKQGPTCKTQSPQVVKTPQVTYKIYRICLVEY